MTDEQRTMIAAKATRALAAIIDAEQHALPRPAPAESMAFHRAFRDARDDLNAILAVCRDR